ncbi:MAG: hypothetical protein H0X47_14330 [Nitrospirales bacterium]|nr:hypothetical protein [Nitrospirales bacterium]
MQPVSCFPYVQKTVPPRYHEPRQLSTRVRQYSIIFDHQNKAEKTGESKLSAKIRKTGEEKKDDPIRQITPVFDLPEE